MCITEAFSSIYPRATVMRFHRRWYQGTIGKGNRSMFKVSSISRVEFSVFVISKQLTFSGEKKENQNGKILHLCRKKCNVLYLLTLFLLWFELIVRSKVYSPENKSQQ
jgi:hypothetical protein